MTMPAGAPMQGWQFGDHHEWFVGYASKVFARSLGRDRLWCPRWREHPEADVVVDSLWRSWETLVGVQPGAEVGAWFVSLGYPLMYQLMDPEGTFKNCRKNGQHEVLTALPDDAGTPSH